MICIPLTTHTLADSVTMLHEAQTQADIIEIRLDYLDNPADAQKLLATATVPCIATWRRVEDGGHHSCDNHTRLSWLHKAADWGAQYIDVEIECADSFTRPAHTTIIVSHHNFEGFPDDFEKQLARISAHPLCDIAKIAVKVDTIQDNLRIFKALQTSTTKTIALGMGELGMISRIASKVFGGYLTFASLRPGAESAPGQLSAHELQTRYRYNKLNKDTKLYGIIANPVAHSMSPDIHNAAFEALNLNALYLPFKVEGDPAQFIEDFKTLPIHGYSVTIPHKESVQKALTSNESLAQDIGALNTIVRHDDGTLHGYNSDCWAATNAIAKRISLDGKKVLIIGAGGSARAIAFGLASQNAIITITNRTFSRAETLAKQCKGTAIERDAITATHWDVIVNTTSVGMHPHTENTPFPQEGFTEGTVVFDAIYNPLQTRFLKEAQAHNCHTINGVEMFIAQGARQFELWTQHKAPLKVMEQTMLATLQG